MAVVRFTGFELGAVIDEIVDASSGTFSIQNSTVRTGDYALRCNPTTSAVGHVTFSSLDGAGANSSAGFSKSTLWVRVYFRYATKPGSGSEPIAAIFNGTTSLSQIRITSAGNLQLWDSPNNAQVGSNSSTALSANTWYMVELKMTNSTAGGNWELWINGTQEIAAAPTSHSALELDLVRIGKNVSLSNQTVDFFYDDLVVDDASRPGQGAVYRLDPDANGNYTAFAAGTGSGGYQEVDDYPAAGNDGDTSYVVSSTQNDMESAQCESCSSAGVPSTSTVAAVVAVAVSRDESTTLSKIVGLRSGSTDSLSTGSDGPATYVAGSSRHWLRTTDPSTSAAWTQSGVDAAEPLIKHNQAAVRALRLTALCLMVDTRVPNIVEADGSSSGASTDSGVGSAVAASAASSAGTATALAAGVALWVAIGASAGAAADSAVGAAVAAGFGACTGAATDAAVGAALAPAVGSSDGVATALGASEAIATGVGAAAGTATADAPGAAVAMADGLSVGASVADGQGESLIPPDPRVLELAAGLATYALSAGLSGHAYRASLSTHQYSATGGP